MTTPPTDARCRNARYSPEGGNKLFDSGGLHLHVLPSGAKSGGSNTAFRVRKTF
jgi:hypothetical protein